MGFLQSIPLLVALVAGTVAGITDIWKFKVYNLLTVPLFASGLLFHAWTGGKEGLGMSLSGSGFGFAILLVPYLMGGVGAGDVKLMAGLGAWLGMPATFYVFAISAMATGVYAVVLMLQKGTVREAWINLQILFYQTLAVTRYLGSEETVEAATRRADRRRRLIPFAAMMPIGIVIFAIWQRF